jgi:hypothetical protein
VRLPPETFPVFDLHLLAWLSVHAAVDAMLEAKFSQGSVGRSPRRIRSSSVTIFCIVPYVSRQCVGFRSARR